MAHSKFSRTQIKQIGGALWPTAVASLNEDAIDVAPSPEEVARRAYFSYLNQGSLPGHDVRHWLEAETQLLAESRLTPSPTPPTQDNRVGDPGRESASPSEDGGADGMQTRHDSQTLFRICALL